VTAVSKPKPQVIEDEEHQRVFERVAAIDVAKASGMVCVRLPGRDGRPRASKVWEVPAVTSAVTELGRRLLSDRVQMVTLEATSDYWRIFYYLLEALGLAVQLVSPAQARQLKGRPKTDLLTELADRSLGWCVRSPVMLARFRPRDQRRGCAAGVVRAGGAAARLA
jgi:transposase